MTDPQTPYTPEPAPVEAESELDRLRAENEALRIERDTLRRQYEGDRGTVRAAVEAAERAEKANAALREALEKRSVVAKWRPGGDGTKDFAGFGCGLCGFYREDGHDDTCPLSALPKAQP